MGAAETDTAADLALPQDLVFVDLETTGPDAAHHRITEIGIVRMQCGVVTDEWSSLVNPESRIPPYIESFTGITNEMVAAAPRFADLAQRVLEKLRSPLFVAHNARFDYGFLRSEFRRLDLAFSAPVMCTVKLSRRLFPAHPRHSLDAVMARHGLTCAARHRALGDARVLSDFWYQLLHEVPESRLAAAARQVIGSNRLPAHLPPGLADELPEGPGVYRFFGEDGVLLYVGRSHSLRTRILGHFASEHANSREQKKASRTHRIDWVQTAGDLGSQLKELQWIKTLAPLYNRRVKPSDPFTLRMAEHGPGIELAAFADVDAGEFERCFGVFHSCRDSRRALEEIARANALCFKAMGLEAGGAGSCLGYALGKCRGACVGKEPLLLHRARAMLALAALKLKPWPFAGRVALREGDSAHVLDHWMYLGTARSDDELRALAAEPADAAFDADVYRILVRYLAKNPNPAWQDLRVEGPWEIVA
jgi:DNA polymerase-3 subunit epsilon